MDIINKQCEGMLEGMKLKAVIPGGASTPYLTPDMIDVGLDYESLASVGSMLVLSP